MTYDELQDRITQWLEDDSSELVEALPQIIKLAEESIFYMTSGNLPCYEKTGTAQLIDGTAIFRFPDGMLMIDHISCSSRNADGELEYCYLDKRTEDWARNVFPSNSDELGPRFYYTRGYTVHVFPFSNENRTYGFLVDGKGFETPLGVSNPTNWVSTNAENALFNECLKEAAKVLRVKPKLYIDDTMKALQGLVAYSDMNKRTESGRVLS